MGHFTLNSEAFNRPKAIQQSTIRPGHSCTYVIFHLRTFAGDAKLSCYGFAGAFHRGTLIPIKTTFQITQSPQHPNSPNLFLDEIFKMNNNAFGRLILCRFGIKEEIMYVLDWCVQALGIS
jgi:hypothetical protein